MYRYFLFDELMMQMLMLKDIYLARKNSFVFNLHEIREEILTCRLVVDGGGGGIGGGNGIAKKNKSNSHSK